MFDIITDSACDLTQEMIHQLGLTVVPFYVSIDGQTYLKEGQEMAVRDATTWTCGAISRNFMMEPA